MDQQTGKYIIVAGAVVIILGVLIYFFHDKLHWVGRLPGDIRVEKDSFRFYLPITTMILFSVVITMVLYLVKRFL
ncbi:MAG: DUF2905 domain-containing protein [Flavisolibacter sp.]